VYSSGFYRISPRIHLTYDVALFADMIQRSESASAGMAIDLISASILLYKYDFLRSLHNYPWVEKRRGELRRLYGEALATLARMSEADEHKREALGLYIRALMTNRQREDLVRHIMRLYGEFRLYEDAEKIYRLLEDELDKTIIAPPSNETVELITRLRAQAAMIS
jgi:two-component SAPR family response regulator